MIKQIFQNMIAPKTAVSVNNFGRNFNVTGVSEGIFTRMFYQLRQRGHALIKKWQREHEIAESIIHLRSLTNEQLCDMGITRDDIPHVVRCGKDAIGPLVAPEINSGRDCIEAIKNAAVSGGYFGCDITYGAGHDSIYINEVCTFAKIFVPGKDGISHNPAESNTPNQAFAGVDVMLKTIMTLANLNGSNACQCYFGEKMSVGKWPKIASHPS